MPRNFSRFAILVGAALFAGVPALHAQQTGAPVRGDVDGDGRITAADARIVSDYLVGKPVPAGANVRERGDVNGDGRVTAVDAAIIARAAAGRAMSRFPVGKAPGDALAVLECTGDIRTSSVECHAPGAPAGGARGDIVVGGQNVNVKLTSANNLKVAPDTFQFTVTVQNLLHQAMAADSGTGAANPTGVRVFFASGPSVTGGGGSISVANADGMGTYTGTNQRYFQYAGTDLGPDGILSPNEVSQPKTWKLQYTGSPQFSFLLFLSTPMKYPKGWVDIYPPNNHYSSPDSVFADTVVAGRTLQLQDSVRNPFGGYIPGAPVTWSNTSNGKATVNPSTGLVSTTVGASGVDSVTATSGPRSGTVAIVVTPPTGANSVISASPLSVSAGDTSLVTVQVKDGFGRNVTTGGDAVTLTTSLGTLVATAGNGTTVTPNDNGNGTYTAKLTSTTTGTANLTGTVLGGAIGTTASVTIGPAAPANISATSTNPQNGTVGAAVGSAPTVHVTDQFGNAVPGVTVTFAVTGGGGSLTGATPATNASGNATLGSWTLGSTAPGPNALSATVSGGSNPSTTFTAFVPAFVVTDSSQAMGNTTLSSSVAPNALANDFSINGAGGVSIKPAFVAALTTARSGTLTLAANGTFSYLPPAGNVLRDSVAYEIQDTHYTGPTAASGYIKLRFVGKVWYVDNTNGGAADGRDVSPFTSVGAAATAAGATDSILVRTGSGTTTGGTLKAGQLVYGQGASSPFTTTLNAQSVTLLSAGSAPTIGALTLGTGGTGNTLRGFTDSGGITGPSGFGTLTVAEVGINNPGGQALSLTNGTLAGGFTSLISGGGTNNVFLSGVSTSGTSTLGASGNALSGATGDAVVVTSGSGSFTFPGNVIRGISVTNNTGGTVTFSGSKNISSGTGAGVTITGNAAAVNVAFTNGNLAITTSTGTPFTATGAGTVEVSGSGNTISATGAAARLVNLSGITIPSGGMSFASITSSTSTTATAFSATSVAGSGGGAFTAGSLTVAGTTGGSSRGVDLTTNSAPFTFTTASVNGTGAEGIYLNGNTGAVAVNGGSVGNTSNTTGDALFVSGGNAAVTVAASLTKSNAGRVANIGSHTAGNVTVSGTLSCTSACTGINVASNSGGTIDFSNATKTLNTGGSAAVTATNNTGASIIFSGGNLDIDTNGAATAFNASTGGTLEITGSNNSINAVSGTALRVDGLTIGAGGLNFVRIDASNGANGIFLKDTGTGGLTVSGTGSAGTGGSISGTTGADGATSGNGVYLENARDVSLSWMNSSNHANNGLYGTGVRGNLTLTNLTFSGNQGSSNSGSFEESAIHLVNVGGQVKITNSNISGGAYDNVRVLNNTGAAPTVDSLVFANNVLGTMQGSSVDARNHAVTMQFADGTADVRIRKNDVNFWWGTGLHVLFQSTASGTVAVTGNNVTQGNATPAPGASGIVVDGGNIRYDIVSDTVVGSTGAAIAVDEASNLASIFHGTISNNVIGTTGVANSGSSQGSGISVIHLGAGTSTHSITNNVIRQINGIQAILLQGGDASASGGNGTFNATVTGNDIQEAGTTLNSGRSAIILTAGTGSGDGHQFCVDIGGAGGLKNNIVNFNTASAGNTNRIRPNQRFSTTVRMPGYGGANNDNAAVATYLLGRNTATQVVASNSVATGGGGYVNTVGGAACPQP